jgi:hypothetical protein
MEYSKNLSISGGLSMTQATNISNLCYQRTLDIERIIESINNYSRTIEYNGKTLTETVGNKMPTNIFELIDEKCELHALQAFLMEQIKFKDKLLQAEQNKVLTIPDTGLVIPDEPKTIYPKLLDYVDETYGWNELTNKERNEYIKNEAYASHIGRFIHKNAPLDKLRTELTKLKTLDWFEIETGKKIPVEINIHHTPEELLEIHNKFAELHREYEKKVNFIKAKVKNITTLKNSEIAKLNSIETEKVKNLNLELINEYNKANKELSDSYANLLAIFEKEKFERINEISKLKIVIDPIYQNTVDKLLNLYKKDEKNDGE